MNDDDRDSRDGEDTALRTTVSEWRGGIKVLQFLLGGSLLAGIAAAITFGGMIARMEERQRAFEARLVDVATVAETARSLAVSTDTQLREHRAGSDVQHVGFTREHEELRKRIDQIEHRRRQ